MLPTSLAFAWVLWRQHRWGFAALLGHLILAGTLFTALSAQGILSFLIVPLYFVPVYLLVVFTYGLEVAELSSRESCFPARLFRLPVPTAAVVRWPLVYGAATVVLLWFVVAWFVLRPWLGYSLPLWWPAALFLAAALAVDSGGLLWSPFGLPGFGSFCWRPCSPC